MVDFGQVNDHWDVFTLVGGCPLPTNVYKKIKDLRLH